MNQQASFDPFQDPDNLSSIEGIRRSVETLRLQFDQGHGKSGYLLALLITPGTLGIPADVQEYLQPTNEKAAECYIRAYDRLLHEAQHGDAESMYLVALYYQSGLPPVSIDDKQYHHWRNQAIRAGYRGGGQL